MAKKHLFRISAPKFWDISRKEKKYTIHPSPGPHGIDNCIPLGLIIRDYLKYAKTSREANRIINQGKIEVDGIVRKDDRFPVGLMDVLTIKELSEHYRLLFDNKGNMILHKISKEESNIKPVKIINKTIIKNKKVQINLFDGKNTMIDKDIYKTADTLVYDLSKKTFSEHIKFEKGSLIYLMDGKQIGKTGILESIQEQRGNEPTKIILKNGKEKFETLKDYAFVIGKDKSLISLPKENE